MKIPRLSDPEKKKKLAEMSFFDHLDELRGVLFTCIAVIVIFSLGAWFISQWLLDFLVKFTVGDAQFIKPHEAFLTRFKLSLMIGFIIGLPFVAYKVWSFVVPGLMKREKTVVLPLVFWSTTLFLIGIAFSVFVLSPVMLKFLASFETETVQSNLAVGYLFDFYLKMGFACGLLFQLPLVIGVLSFFGLVTPQLLRSMWRHAIVGILILAAVVTPADVLSQMMLGLPIIILYFISILVSAAIQKSKRERENEAPEYTEEGSDPDDDPGPDTGAGAPEVEPETEAERKSDSGEAEPTGQVKDTVDYEAPAAPDSDQIAEAVYAESDGHEDAEAEATGDDDDEDEDQPAINPNEDLSQTSPDDQSEKRDPLKPPPDDWCI